MKDLISQLSDEDAKSVKIKKNEGNVKFRVHSSRYLYFDHHRQAEVKEAEEDNEGVEMKHALIKLY